VEERFWSKVDIKSKNECWIWKGALDYDGYRIFNFNGITKRTHVIAMMKKEKITKGNQVLHICDNPPCCNPKHLKIGTHQDNMDDMIKKNRANKAFGEKNGNSKLTVSNVKKIRLMYANGEFSMQDIGSKFGISRMNVCDIVNNKIWRDLND